MQLLLFLQSCYGDVESTKECMLNYFSCILEVPQFFDHWDINREHIKQGLDTVYVEQSAKFDGPSPALLCRFTVYHVVVVALQVLRADAAAVPKEAPHGHLQVPAHGRLQVRLLGRLSHLHDDGEHNGAHAIRRSRPSGPMAQIG